MQDYNTSHCRHCGIEVECGRDECDPCYDRECTAHELREEIEHRQSTLRDMGYRDDGY